MPAEMRAFLFSADLWIALHGMTLYWKSLLYFSVLLDYYMKAEYTSQQGTRKENTFGTETDVP